ncbi:hypothetical protein ACIB24_21535 [Spongisporangium articulatum]|uniref:FG-GAP repeat-containing protein n=1 Tax=Spongisporangium articulatum TaxID=3362603 RepID=A0ABW8ATJ4_9ACTN
MSPATRVLAACSIAVLGLGSLVAASGPAHAAVACVDTGGTGDFNGDGVADQVAGDPGATVSGRAKAGRIDVRYGKAGGGFGSSTTIAQGSAQAGGTAETNDGFGQTLAVGFVDGDKCADVVVGTPGENLGEFTDVGQVEILFGGPDGLGSGRAPKTISGNGFAGPRSSGSRYGAALALASDIDRNGAGETGRERYAQLAIGVPGLPVGGRARAGGVVLLSFDDTATTDKSLFVSQDTAGVTGVAEAGDAFGSSLVFGSGLSGACTNAIRPCQDLMVGVPGENEGAGAVELLVSPLTAAQVEGDTLSQATPGVAGAAEAGDEFGAALAVGREPATLVPWVAVGIPGEDVGKAKDAGSVQLLRFGDKDILNTVVGQDSKGISGTAEAGDRFGASVAIGSVQHDFIELSLAAGVPGEDVGDLKDVGGVAGIVFTTSGARGSDDVFVTQDSTGVPGKAEAGERFGSVLADRGTLRLGVPDDKGYPAGAVFDLTWDTLFGLSTKAGTAWTVSGGSRFGAAIG